MPQRKPDARKHNPDPEYIRSAIAATGLSLYKLSDQIGVTRAGIYKWIKGESPCPYPAQFCIESLRQHQKRKSPT